MKKYRNGGPVGKRIPGALYPGDPGYIPPPGNVGWRDPNVYRHANDRFYVTDQEYIDLRFQPGPGEPVNRPVVKMPPGSPAVRSTTQVPVDIVKQVRVQGYEPGQWGHVRYDEERRFENGGIMNDNLKKMYASGGMLKALLKDPAQRAMAAKMLASNTDSVVDGNAGRGGTKKYSTGGNMYANGGPVKPATVVAKANRYKQQTQMKPEYRGQAGYDYYQNEIGNILDNVGLDGWSRGGTERYLQAFPADESGGFDRGSFLRYLQNAPENLGLRPEDLERIGTVMTYGGGKGGYGGLRDMYENVMYSENQGGEPFYVDQSMLSTMEEGGRGFYRPVEARYGTFEPMTEEEARAKYGANQYTRAQNVAGYVPR